MATYRLSYDKLKQLERIASDYPAYTFKIMAEKLYDKNFELLKEHYLNLNFGKILLWKGFERYNTQQASQDAHTLLHLANAFSVGGLVKQLQEKEMCSCSMLSSEQEIDLVTLYDTKETLYRISSYIQAQNLGYDDVLVSYSELKDIENIVALYDNGDLEDLTNKYFVS